MKFRINLMKYRYLWLALALAMTLASIGSIVFRGFNLGIDFTGGTMMDIRFEQPVTVSQVRDVLDDYNLGNSVIQIATEGQTDNGHTGRNVLIRTKVLEEQDRAAIMKDLSTKVGPFDIQRVEKVGATVGGELTKDAFLAFGIATLLMLCYIGFRFEFRFAFSGIIALIHDLVVTIGIFSFLQREIDSSFVAAILTILGFSINDTIVIFDRIRENLRSFKRGESLVKLVNDSIWQTMTRSIYTVMTVLFSTVSLYLFGGDTTKDFALALTIGFAFGSFSSIFIAPSCWLLMKGKEVIEEGEETPKPQTN